MDRTCASDGEGGGDRMNTKLWWEIFLFNGHLEHGDGDRMIILKEIIRKYIVRVRVGWSKVGILSSGGLCCCRRCAGGGMLRETWVILTCYVLCYRKRFRETICF
jgi:hypothetical protein